MLKNAAVYLRVSTEKQSKHWGVQAPERHDTCI